MMLIDDKKLRMHQNNGYANPAAFTEDDRLQHSTDFINTNGAKSEHPAGIYVIPTVSGYLGSSNGHATNGSCSNHLPNGNGKMNGESSRGRSSKYLDYPDYDPYQHRECKNPTTYWDTMFHLLKASLGTGILAMPKAFQNAGYAVATIGTIIIGFLCTYNIHILIRSEYELCRRKRVPNMSFPTTVESAFEEGPKSLRWFAPYGRFITNWFLVMYQIGSSAIYIVFIAKNISDVYSYYYPDLHSETTFKLYMLLPLILICWVRNLKLLVPFSTVANVGTMISFIIIFIYMFQDIPAISERDSVGSAQGMPLFFGTVLFAMEAIGVIMPLKNQMKKPEKFGSLFGVLNAAMLPICLLYTFIGFFGYLKYGSDTKGSITLNLNNEELSARLVKLMYAGAIYITYGLSNYIAFDIIWINSIEPKIESTNKKSKVIWEYIVRTLIVFVTFILAVVIPNLELFISLIGALCLSTMGIAFPPIIQLLTEWNSDNDRKTSRFALLLLKNAIIVLIAIFAFIVGVSTSVAEIFALDSHSHSQLNVTATP